MMATTVRDQVPCRCLAAFGIRDDVVEVAALCGFGAVREHAVVVTQGDVASDPVGDLVGVDRLVAVEVEDRADEHGAAGGVDPGLDLLRREGGAGVAQPADGLIVRIQVQDQLGLAAGHSAGDLPGLRVGDVEVEGEVLAGELTGRDRTSHIEGFHAAELTEDLGPAGDRVLEVEGIGSIEGAGDVGGAVEPGLVQVDVEVPQVLGVPALLLSSRRVEPDEGFLDQPVDLHPGHAVGEGCDLPVHEPGRILRQDPGGVGDPERFPHRHLPLQDPVPGLGQPVGQLDDLPDVAATGVQGPAEERTEFHDREVADERGTGTGQRQPRIQPAFGQRRGIAFVGDDVFGGPFGDRPGGGDLAFGDDGAVVADLDQQLL